MDGETMAFRHHLCSTYLIISI